MDKPKTNQWVAGAGSDPEKYKRLSTPFESRDEAQRAVEAFTDALSKLRETYHIAELVCQIQVYVKTEDTGKGIETMISGGGWGNQTKQALLIKRMVDRFMQRTKNRGPAANM